MYIQAICIYKKNWSSPDGTQPLIPKDEGQGLMLSSFVSREFGYSMTLSPEELEKVNEYREGQSYSDENAAIVKNGSRIKPKLTKSPFVQTLEYGANAGGYWNYDSMNLQLEDCIDYMTALYPHIQPVFLFDHSCELVYIENRECPK
jgi:hypothetical protein